MTRRGRVFVRRGIVLVMGVVWKVLLVMGVGRVFVRPLSDKLDRGMVDRRRIGLVNNVRNKTSLCNFIYSSGYPSLDPSLSWSRNINS
jgi:hypothetical protein